MGMHPRRPGRPKWASVAGALVAVAMIGAPHLVGQQVPPPQEPQQPTPVFRAKVDVVRVDVSVTGRGDAPVVDLQATDFEVEEDGVPQVIQTAQFVRLDG